jgi:hypothetical protein
MEKKFKLKMVAMPNFLSVESPPRPRQEGMREGIIIPVGDLSPEEAAKYAEWMKLSFIEHWRKKQQ